MNWKLRHELLRQQLSPEVARFVLLALNSIEQENVFDAPGVISGVLRRMRVADSDVVRNATGRTERSLLAAFAGRSSTQRLGA